MLFCKQLKVRREFIVQIGWSCSQKVLVALPIQGKNFLFDMDIYAECHKECVGWCFEH